MIDLAVDKETPTQQRGRIAGRAAVVAAGTLLSRVLGLGRDIVLAAVFSRAATDAWMLAFQIPNLLRQLLAEGAVQAAVLPVLQKERAEHGEAAAQRFFRSLRGASLILLSLTTGLGIAFAGPIVSLFAPGFRDLPGQFELTVLLTQLAFPYLFCMSAAALGMAALNSHGRFFVTSFSPGLLNVSFIVCALSLPSMLVNHGRPAIIAMALGALLGGLLQVVSQVRSLAAIGYLGLPSFRLHPAVRDIGRRLAPTLLGVGVYYVDVMIGRRMLSEMGSGAITYYSYALRLCDFSQGIFIMALSSATLPVLAGFAARGELEEVGRTFSYSIRHALFIGLLATVTSVVLAEPLVSLLLERGQFGPVATRETTHALIAQGMSIFLVAGVRQLVLVYFALGDTRTPVLVAALDVLVFAGTALALRGHWGHVGVSIAVSVARVGQFVLLFWYLKRRLPQVHGREILGSAQKALTASLIAALLAGAVLHLLPASPSESFLWRSFRLFLPAATLLGVFFLGCKALHVPELETLVRPLMARFSRGRRGR